MAFLAGAFFTGAFLAALVRAFTGAFLAGAFLGAVASFTAMDLAKAKDDADMSLTALEEANLSLLIRELTRRLAEFSGGS